MDCSNLFTGKRITVMGLGLLGRGVGDAAFLAECGAQVLVTDMKTEEELAESVLRLKKYSNITFHLGQHDEKDFTDCDMVVKAAGVPLNSSYIEAAHKAGVEVVMSTALFAKYAIAAGATIVGVTGTRGKSTVTQMIYDTLKLAGKDVLLGGNVRGVSTLAMLPQISEGTGVILELDSWQLQGFGYLKISPHIAVFTNLMPDHMNYYDGDMDAYFADKANIFKYQHAADTLIMDESVVSLVRVAQPVSALVVAERIPDEWVLKIPGEHNRVNASLAAAAVSILGLFPSSIKEGIESFVGVEGRLQLVTEIRGVKIYNDNNATTPEATIAALKALNDGKKNIVLIAGGADKGLDTSVLLLEISESCKRVILLPGTGTARITPFMQDYSVYDDMESAVREALASAVEGDSILFSPAFASFGSFKNEYDRNDQFMSLINTQV